MLDERSPVTQQPRNIRHAVRLRLPRRLCGGSEAATRLLLGSGVARVAPRRQLAWKLAALREARRARRDDCGDCGYGGDGGDGGDQQEEEIGERHLPCKGVRNMQSMCRRDP